ncbi:MAG TPA: PmoA family protein [Verrucomicrobiota bacterium]|nr:PmoA family protein [Verrucomicrobiota bacterium]
MRLASLQRSRSRAPVAVFAVLLIATITTGCVTSKTNSAPSQGVQLTKLDDRVRVEINGALFTEYHFANTPKPFCWPLIGPGGVAMTRSYPMKALADEGRDHPHHRSFWFAHGEVNGVDFWTERATAGKIVHAGFDGINSGKDSGVIKSRNDWISADGKIICTDDRTLRFHNRDDSERMIDFEITFHASNGDLTLGDTKEGTMAVRVAESMRVAVPVAPGEKKLRPGDGHIVNSEGLRDNAAWGKRAAWCDYYGPVDGKIVGIAIFDDPRNPHHPTWWMARDYGLLTANPFGQHDFEPGADRHAGQIIVPAGGSVTFRYRFLLHEGDDQQGKVAERYKEFVQSATKEAK